MTDKPADNKGQGTTPSKPTRVHPTERAKIAGSNLVSQLRGITPDLVPKRSYYSPELIQCTLPHSDPKAPAWVRRNGNYSLIVSSGFDEHGQPIGVPYGSFPRLMLAHIITRVTDGEGPRIELSDHFSTFLREVGYIGNNRGKSVSGRRLRDQLLRLLRANITFQYHDSGLEQERIGVRDVKVAPDFALWFDYRNPEQGSLFGSWIELSEKFYQSVKRAPVPMRTDVLKALKRSPLALDIYMWLSYRLFSMNSSGQTELSLSYSALQAQFGTGIAEENYRQFRSEFRRHFANVARFWQAPEEEGGKILLNYELNETGLVLYASPLSVSRNKLTKQEERAQLLKARSFDLDTQRRAKQLSANWDLNYLTEQYFAWIEGEGIEPIAPRRHFLAFIKSHVDRNGKG